MMNTDDVLSGIKLLLEAHNRHDLQIKSQPTTRIVEEDEEADLESPIFDSFYNADGNQGIMSLMNFTSVDFRSIYENLQSHIISS